MRATLIFVKEGFKRFNAEYFGMGLPTPNFRISHSSRTLGTLSHPRHFRGTPCGNDFTLSISNRFDMEQSVIEDTIIHEMIHLHILYNGIADRSAHGPAFRKIMTEINRRHGRSISVTHKTSEAERASDRLRKPVIVMSTYFKDGTTCVTVCNPRYAGTLVKSLRRIPTLREWRLHLSANAEFSRYPVSRTLKFYRIGKEELDAALAGARPIRYADGKFSIV